MSEQGIRCCILQAVPNLEGSGEAEALRVLLLKSRDRDAAVREAAYEILGALPARTLHALLLPSDWRGVLDCGLGVWAELCPPGPANAFFSLFLQVPMTPCIPSLAPAGGKPF
jgi:hypothetical protein